MVNDADGILAVGSGLPGRGAWLCPEVTCVDTAIRRRSLPRALKAEIPAAELERLRLLLMERGRISKQMSGMPEKGLKD